MCEEHDLEAALRDEEGDLVDSDDVLRQSTGDFAESKGVVVQSEELQKVLGHMGRESKGGRQVWAAAMRELREQRKVETGVRSLREV
jgi:hypothetical protein